MPIRRYIFNTLTVVSLLLLLGAVGCSESPQTQRPNSRPYSDAHVEELIAKHSDKNAYDPILDVVPSGESRKKKAVLDQLGIDEARLSDNRLIGINKVIHVIWQISESYHISWMTGALEDPLKLHEDDRLIYGVRITKRAEDPYDGFSTQTLEELSKRAKRAK